MSHSPFTTTVLGYPRIGRERELKKALERYWAGTSDRESLMATAATIRSETRATLTAAGLDSVPVNTFSYYDQVLDAAVLLGAVPARFAGIGDHLDRYFAMARGTAEIPPLEMTKWFDTNYHYLVPEIAADTAFALHPETVLTDLAEAIADGTPARPVILGPVSFLLLSKSTDGADLLARLDELLPLYSDLLELLAEGGADWVQIDEPALVGNDDDATLAAARSTFTELAARDHRPAILVATYFGSAHRAVAVLADTDIEGIAVDLVAGELPGPTAGLAGKLLVAGVVDGRNIWRTDPDRALAALGTALGTAAQVAVSTSCSLLHVPYCLATETHLDEELHSWLAFADEKLAEVTILSKALRGNDSVTTQLAEGRAAVAGRRTSIRIHSDRVQARLSLVDRTSMERTDYPTRAALQAERLGLPRCPPPPSVPFRRPPRCGSPAGICCAAASPSRPMTS